MLRHRSRPFSGLFSASSPRHAPKRSSLRGRRLWVVEGLENRVLLAATVYTVNATTDTGAGSGTTGDLLYCIDQANANSNTAGSVIQFDPTVFGTPQTITLSSTLTLSETAGPEDIDGPGASLVTVSGNNAVEVFSVSSGVMAVLTGLTITDGRATRGGGLSSRRRYRLAHERECDQQPSWGNQRSVRLPRSICSSAVAPAALVAPAAAALAAASTSLAAA